MSCSGDDECIGRSCFQNRLALEGPHGGRRRRSGGGGGGGSRLVRQSSHPLVGLSNAPIHLESCKSRAPTSFLNLALDSIRQAMQPTYDVHLSIDEALNTSTRSSETLKTRVDTWMQCRMIDSYMVLNDRRTRQCFFSFASLVCTCVCVVDYARLVMSRK